MTDSSPLFAVVDIEATSGTVDGNQGMIQFACILFQDGKIIQEFDTLVNPLRKIPWRIRKLTGISQSQVEKAPTFEEIAPIVRDLLDEAIFVAHNVAFDFEFLNEQFLKVGLEPLRVPAVDTVSLSEVVFPQADHYNLSDLSAYLGYEIDQAHNALDDARATVYLLEQLIDKLTNLPLVTLEKLVDLSTRLDYQSAWLIDWAFKRAQDSSQPLPGDLMVHKGIAMVNPNRQFNIYQSQSLDYPVTDQEKQVFFESSFSLRDHQGELMDQIYHYFQKETDDQELAIEAPSGMGKSIGYLVPSVFNHKRVVISTYTKTLQDQLLDEAIPLLRQVTPLDPSVVVLKGLSNYLSLTTFIDVLKTVKAEDTEALICMRILVWLTETKTGDLSELGKHSLSRHYFWNQLTSSYSQLDEMDDFDFYKRHLKKAQSADIIITNHAHLMTDLGRDHAVLPDFDHLIIDEAHHLPRVISSLSQVTFSRSTVTKLLRQIGTKNSPDTLIDHLSSYSQSKWLKAYEIQAIESTRALLLEQVSQFFDQFNDLTSDFDKEFGWNQVSLGANYFSARPKNLTKQIKQSFENLIYQLQNLYASLLKYEDEFTVSDQVNLNYLHQASLNLENLYQNFVAICLKPEPNSLTWLEAYGRTSKNSMQVKALSQQARDKSLESLHSIKHLVYISSTMAVKGSVDFFEKQIQSPNLNYLEFRSPYQLKDQAKILLPSEMTSVKKLSRAQLVDQLVRDIVTISRSVNRKTLILFHSHEVLQMVYETILEMGVLDHYRLLAQDISGNRQKIIKQFKSAQNSILFGSDSFFEGIDLPGNLLELVILTRLPFDSPDMPLVQNEHMRLKKSGSNIFMEDLLPRAVIKTKQAFGRLIRSESDRGVFVILDDRYLTANYSKVFQESMPNGGHYEQVALKDMAKTINDFLSDD